MNLILCLDDRGGMAFNKRRQSRDANLTADLCRLTAGGVLRVHPYSVPLFPDGVCRASETYLADAGGDDWCFTEREDVTAYLPDAKTVILYRWNRVYPADLRFDTAALGGFRLTERTEFAGTSHDVITREVYRR